MFGHAPQPGLLHCFLHHDAGGVQAFAGIGFALEHADAQAVLGSRQCAGGTGEAGADDDHVMVVSGGDVGHRCITGWKRGIQLQSSAWWDDGMTVKWG